MVSDFVAHTAARVLGRQGETIDLHRPLSEMGLDSLLAIELRNRLGTALGIGRSLPATLVFDFPTVAALAQHLDERLRAPLEGVAVPSRARASPSATSGIDEMSDEQVDAMFDRMTGT
jgi:acyl carrier protein